MEIACLELQTAGDLIVSNLKHEATHGMWLSADRTHRHPASAGLLCAGNSRFRPIADVTTFPERCMVFATLNRKGWLIATGFLLVLT